MNRGHKPGYRPSENGLSCLHRLCRALGRRAFAPDPSRHPTRPSGRIKPQRPRPRAPRFGGTNLWFVALPPSPRPSPAGRGWKASGSAESAGAVAPARRSRSWPLVSGALVALAVMDKRGDRATPADCDLRRRSRRRIFEFPHQSRKISECPTNLCLSMRISWQR